MSAFFREQATGRNVLIGLVVVAALMGLSQLLLVPAYRAVAAGFVPLNLQYPLTQEMIAIQRGAFSAGIRDAYLVFAAVDVMAVLANAMFMVLLWSWLGARAAGTIAEPALSRGLLLLPVLGAVCGIADVMCIANLVFANRGDPLHDWTQTVLAVHRVRNLVTLVTNAITVGLVSLAIVTTVSRRRRRA